MSEPRQPSSAYNPKKLIICCDGTWRNSDSGIFKGTGLAWLWRGQEQVATNVTRISRAIKTTDNQGRQQIVYYQAGVGSEGNLLERIFGGALGVGLAANIREAYSFLANNYVPGDEIYLVGFSRGAFTARSIGGMISDLGLLTTDGLENLVDIFEDWENAGSEGYQTLLAKDNSAFTMKSGLSDPKAYVSQYRSALQQIHYTRPETIPIKAIAVWDTVGSLGIPVNPILQRIGFPTVLREYRFYNTDLSPNVQNAFQALALDEKRSAYRPAVWQKLPENNTTNLKQCWFPGVHTNIGGGYPDSGLSDITLAWMMSQLQPFLTFTPPSYITDQHQKTQQYLKNAHVPQLGLKWAASQLKNTSSGLRALLGITPRQPGQYHVLNKKTLTIVHDKPLQNTNEHIHVAVRSRMKTGGLDAKNQVREYSPRALQGYECLDPQAEPGKSSWRILGAGTKHRDGDENFEGKVLPEDVLGVFEKEIFTDYVS